MTSPMSGSAAKQSSDERTMIRDGGRRCGGSARVRPTFANKMRDASVRVYILGHRKHWRFGMMRNQQPKEFFYGVFPSGTEASIAPAGRDRECRRRPDGPSPAPGVASVLFTFERGQIPKKAKGAVAGWEISARWS